FCGIDWAERHHDIALVDAEGRLVTKRRIPDSADGFAELMRVLTEAGDSREDPIPVAIETPRGLLVSALRETGRAIYSINPMAVARYRERHTVSRKKSDHADAMVLANILRTDAYAHRALPADTELARAVAVLARAAQDAVWRRTKALQELRSLLREYYPGFLAAFHRGGVTNLAGREARQLLALAPTPAAGAKLTAARIATALRRAGRQRGIESLAAEIHQALRIPQLRQLPLVEDAMGRQALALLATLNTECDNADQLGEAAVEAFTQHPDHPVITSFPGMGDLSGARLLAEIGDDRTRFSDARALKAYAGSAPVTRASGRSIAITRRTVKNDRLNTVGFLWAFAAIPRPGPSKEHYDSRRARGDGHAAALRHLFNRMLGQLHHCLQTGQTYDPVKAFGRPPTAHANNAAA
ncbi:IS110 family RNA-guided transposase, partial [Micromonospora echinofusca]|uniref:IS110 family transposase n=1 Tax=Micromonospora echinofusca TaxID=47858 RepID=UPI00371F40C8